MNVADVLSGSTGLEGMRWLLLSTPAREVLEDQLGALLPAGAAVELCLKEARFKPGRKLTAHYDALVTNTESPQRQQVRPVAVTWGTKACANHQEETVALEKIQAEAADRGVAGPFLQLMADVPEWSMHIQVSPLDARFTQLPRLSDPRHVRAILADVYASADPAPTQRPISDYTITCIRYRMNSRHVLRYDPLGSAKGEAVFAKPYIGERGAHAFHVARAVADWLTERDEGVNCPRPLAYVTQDAVVLYQQIFGAPLSEHLPHRTDGLADWLERVGAALHTLHCLPRAVAGPLQARNFVTEIQSIERASSHIHTLLPQMGAAVEALIDRARELHERLPQEPPTFTHRDFKSVHVWIAPDSLTVIDFDRARLADPASDVGDFLANLQWWHAACQLPGLVQAQERFLAGYVPGAPKERLLRARVYEAISLVRCAVRRVPLFEDGCVPRMKGMLCRAEAVLNDLQTTIGVPVRHQFLESG
ncbi:MAG TPA: aminoglycoside phosphotransferase family protein [Candidatus Bathyarchaeia archaeon]|nr:aminoglycoside phosphotransferase family protein [Candidatus Bathyarchaeia archaeon]